MRSKSISIICCNCQALKRKRPKEAMCYLDCRPIWDDRYKTNEMAGLQYVPHCLQCLVTSEWAGDEKSFAYIRTPKRDREYLAKSVLSE